MCARSDPALVSIGTSWDPGDRGEPQPGCTYQVTGDVDSGPNGDLEGLVYLAGAPSDAYLSWLRPATQEEIAAAQLAQLEAGL